MTEISENCSPAIVAQETSHASKWKIDSSLSTQLRSMPLAKTSSLREPSPAIRWITTLRDVPPHRIRNPSDRLVCVYTFVPFLPFQHSLEARPRRSKISIIVAWAHFNWGSLVGVRRTEAFIKPARKKCLNIHDVPRKITPAGRGKLVKLSLSKLRTSFHLRPFAVYWRFT